MADSLYLYKQQYNVFIVSYVMLLVGILSVKLKVQFKHAQLLLLVVLAYDF